MVSASTRSSEDSALSELSNARSALGKLQARKALDEANAAPARAPDTVMQELGTMARDPFYAAMFERKNFDEIAMVGAHHFATYLTSPRPTSAPC